MNISRIITFLVAGVFIGAILFFAGFGVMNLFESKSNAPDTPVVGVQDDKQAEIASQAVPVNPPKIEVTSSSQSSDDVAPDHTLQGEGTSDSPFKIKPLNTASIDSSASVNEEIKPVAFGTLTLSTVNALNNQPINADFLIENSDSVAIALVKDTPTSTLSLPVGDYKITVSQGTEKVVRFLGVKDGQNGSEVFELDIPILTDEAPTPVIAGGATDAPVYTNSEANETTPSTSGVTDEAATTNVAVTTESAVTANTESNKIGGLRLSALTKLGKRPTTASFYIQRLNGQNVQTLRNVKTQQVTLPAGKYKVTAKTDKSTVIKQVEVLATRGVHEIFLISDQPASTQQSTQTADVAPQGNGNQSSSAVSTASSGSSSNTVDANQADKKPGQLELFAQKASNNSPVKSNFYVQMPNGKMVASKIYVDSIGYKLPAGKYKVIVRATGYKNKSTMLNVRAGQTRREVFKLETANSAAQTQNISSTDNISPPPVQPRQQTPPAPARTEQNSTRAYGGLTVNIVAAADGMPLPADMIVITQRDGTQVKQANGVSSASFDLPPQEFLIRVSYGGLTTNHQVNILTGRLAIKTISFDNDRMAREERRRQRRERRNR